MYASRVSNVVCFRPVWRTNNETFLTPPMYRSKVWPNVFLGTQLMKRSVLSKGLSVGRDTELPLVCFLLHEGLPNLLVLTRRGCYRGFWPSLRPFFIEYAFSLLMAEVREANKDLWATLGKYGVLSEQSWRPCGETWIPVCGNFFTTCGMKHCHSFWFLFWTFDGWRLTCDRGRRR